MSSRNTKIISVVVITLFLGAFFLASTVPLFEGGPVMIRSLGHGQSLSSGYFLKKPIELDEGTVEFSYLANGKVNAFIMTEAQYYEYVESFSGYIGSLNAGLDSLGGTLMFEIKQRDTYYFIIENENLRHVSISIFDIKQSTKQTLLELLRLRARARAGVSEKKHLPKKPSTGGNSDKFNRETLEARLFSVIKPEIKGLYIHPVRHSTTCARARAMTLTRAKPPPQCP